MTDATVLRASLSGAAAAVLGVVAPVFALPLAALACAAGAGQAGRHERLAAAMVALTTVVVVLVASDPKVLT